MSHASRVTLGVTFTGAVVAVVGVHYQQQLEKAAMHAGVIRDIDQQRVKKERQADFDMQKALEKEYKAVQKVHDSSQEPGGGAKG